MHAKVKTLFKIDTCFLWRAKTGSRSVRFFTKGSTIFFFAPDLSQKYPGFFKSTRIFLKMFHFSQNVQMAKERANTKVNGRIPKNCVISQK